MKNSKLKMFIPPIVVLIGVVFGLILMYNFVIRQNVNDMLLDQVANAINTRTTSFKSKLMYDYEYFNGLSEEEIKVIKNKESDNFDEIISYYDVEEGVKFDKDKKQVVFFIKKDILTYGVYIPMSKYADHIMMDTQYIEEYYLGNKNMEVLYALNDTRNYLYDYIGDGLVDSKELVHNIQKNEEYLFEVKNTTYYSKHIHLDQDNYLIILYKIVDIEETRVVHLVNTASLVFFITIVLLYIVSVFFVYYAQSNYSKEMLLSLKKIVGSSNYVIITGFNGKIKKYNVFVEKEIPNIEKFNSLKDLIVDHELPGDLRTLKNFISKIMFNDGERFIKFSVTKTFNYVLLIGEDITKDYLESKKLRELVLINPVTKRKNLIALTDNLDTIINSSRNITDTAVIACDVARFDAVNKIFGRHVGNVVLENIASMIEEQIDSEKVSLYHTSEDKFFILIKNMTNVESYSVEFIKRLIEIFKDPLKVNNNLIVIQLKYGLYLLEENVENSDEVISKVRMALKNAKNSRISEYTIYDIHIGRIITKEMQMQSDMVNAVENNEFKLYYQPQYDLKNKRICGFEALIRWANPKYIGESPLKFIEMAEKNDLIIEIGRFVIDEAFKTAKLYEHLNIKISINVSPVQLLQSGFVNDLIQTAEKYDVKPTSIAIEITETVMMELFEDIIEKLRLIKSYGFEIHLDDFGSGYSSLLYLNNLPINVIKIDKEFVRNVKEESTKIIVSKVIAMANGLKLDIIAEGVETIKDAQLIEKYGGQMIQGYFISKPVPDTEIQGILDKFEKENDVVSPNKGKK